MYIFTYFLDFQEIDPNFFIQYIFYSFLKGNDILSYNE